MKRVSFVSALAVIVALSTGLSAEAAGNKKLLPGQVAKDNICKVNQGIDWHTSLNNAQAQAAREGKMILWVQMIGKMDGAT